MKLKEILAALIISVTLFSCDKDDPVVPHEEELITTLKYTLTPVGGGTAVELIYKDLDGEGGNAPVITNGTLAANTTYNGVITVWNEMETPAEDITEEVKSEDDEHQFFFTTPNHLAVTYTDKDGDNNPVGIETEVVTGVDYIGGSLTVILKHEPNKSAEGVANGDATNAGGETDIEVTFDLN